MGIRNFLHLNEHLIIGNKHIAQKHEERLALDTVGCAVNRMTQAERLILIYIAYVQIARMSHFVCVLVLAAAAKLRLEGGIGREVLFDGLLVMAINDDYLVSCRSQALFNNVLDNRTVYHKKHFLGLSLRSGQKTAAQASSRNECFHESS